MNDLFLLAVVWQKSAAAGFIRVFRGRVGGEISGFSLAHAGLWCFQTLLRGFKSRKYLVKMLLVVNQLCGMEGGKLVASLTTCCCTS